MPSVRVVLFIGDDPFYLSGFRNSETHIRGWVENGHWSLYIVKETEGRWKAFEGTSKNNLRDILAKGIKQLDPKAVELVNVPETLRADYNTIINWARAQKREKI